MLNRNAQGEPWTVSGGGPIIVVPAELAAQWFGANPSPGAVVPPGWTWGRSGGPECDYDRACDPQHREGTPYGGFGWVEVAGIPVLVLDAELPTRFVADPEGGHLIRGGVEGSSEQPAVVPAELWHDVGPSTIDLADGRLFMFDSAFRGAADPEAITAHDGVGVIELGPGRWRLSFASTADEVDFVRLRRV